MSVQLFKDGESQFFSVSGDISLESLINAGWFLTKEESENEGIREKRNEEGNETEDEEKEGSEEKGWNDEEKRMDSIQERVDLDSLTESELRRIAKAAKIKKWHVKSIDRLKEEIVNGSS